MKSLCNGCLGTGWKNDSSTNNSIAFIANKRSEVFAFKIWDSIRPQEYLCEYSIINIDDNSIIESGIVEKNPRDKSAIFEYSSDNFDSKMRTINLKCPIKLEKGKGIQIQVYLLNTKESSNTSANAKDDECVLTYFGILSKDPNLMINSLINPFRVMDCADSETCVVKGQIPAILYRLLK